MKNQLKFNDGKFTIMSLGDLHENRTLDNQNKINRRRDMHNFVKTGILAFKPDLIVLLGDTLMFKDESEDFSEYKSALRDVLKPVIDSGIPFCYVLGNHEHDAGQEDLVVSAYKEIETCIGENDPTCPRGNFNCNLLVKNSEGTEDIFNLWFIDSNNVCDNQEISVYDWVHQDQIKWYEEKALEIKLSHSGKTLPAILFQHTPVIEEYQLLREAKPHEIPFCAVEGHHKFKDKKYMLKDGVDGYLGEGPCSPCYNGGQFESWKRTGDVVAAFFGHDHTNDFTGYVDGIMLGQNKTSGFCCYTDGCRSAIRITTVYENDPRNVKSKVYHFKELGLQSTCLGPIEKRITDKQSIAMHKIGYAAAGITAATALTAGAAALIRKFKKK
ncbi:MAG: metallophosphoesterase [Clostridia bacterium]|nr:metallophosphoesterase [Clostridia bacterium]